MDSKKIGAFIKEKRMDAKMTQEELASKLNVSNKTISKWERGLGIPNVDMLEPLSRILGVTIAEILSGENQVKDVDMLIKELKKKKQKRIINLILGIIICLFLCGLEVILYVCGVKENYAYVIIGIFIVSLFIVDIANYLDK